MMNCPSNFDHIFLALHMVTINTTLELEFNSSYYKVNGYDPNYYLTLGYLVVDTVIYPNIEFVYELVQTPDILTDFYFSFYNKGVQQLQTYKAVFMLSVYCQVPVVK